jgi:phosphoribosylaminoimidazole-succinocarboxamide synthase
MARRRRIYEGKAKILFEGPEPGTLVQYFKDDATAFNNQKRGVITGKGVLNNRISEYIMTRLGEIGIPTHFVRRLNMREQLVKSVEIIPIEVVVRNLAAGSFSQRFKLPEGQPLPRAIVEYCYKSDELGDPLVSEEHITAFGWASPQDLDDILALALRINDFLGGLFIGVGLRLVDFKLEFGCGTSRPTRSSTRTASAATSAASRKPIRRWRGAWASCRKPGPGTWPARRSCSRRRRSARVLVLKPGAGPTTVPDGESAAGGRVVKARVHVTLKAGVLDPQGKAIQHALAALGFGGVNEVRQGKVIELDMDDADPTDVRARVEAMCEKLLANTVIEDYDIELEGTS